MNISKMQRLQRGSIAAPVKGVRFRLAEPADGPFVQEMSVQAGADGGLERLDSPVYQSGLRAGLEDPRGGFVQTVVAKFNAGADLEEALTQALFAGSFDLVAVETKSREPVGALRVGPPLNVLSSMCEREDVHEHQLLSLTFSALKVIAVGVEPGHRGHGVGTALLQTGLSLVGKVARPLIVWSEFQSAEARAAHERAGLAQVGQEQNKHIGVGGALNLWPLVGPHTIREPEVSGAPAFQSPEEGPYAAPEPGYTFCARIFGTEGNETAAKLRELNPGVSQGGDAA